MNEKAKILISSNIRHLLSASAGILVAKGIVDAETASSLIAGLGDLIAGTVIYAIPVIWSYFRSLISKPVLKAVEAPIEEKK